MWTKQETMQTTDMALTILFKWLTYNEPSVMNLEEGLDPTIWPNPLVAWNNWNIKGNTVNVCGTGYFKIKGFTQTCTHTYTQTTINTKFFMLNLTISLEITWMWTELMQFNSNKTQKWPLTSPETRPLGSVEHGKCRSSWSTPIKETPEHS